MYALHMSLLALSACALAATGASGALTGPHGGSRDGATLRLLAFVVGGALLIGNAACLLPDTPAWYSTAVVTATAGGLVWLLVTLLGMTRARSARNGRRTAATLRPATGADADIPVYAPLRSVHATAPASATGRVVTADMIHAAGPVGSRALTGSGTYVAAGLDTYLPGRGNKRPQAARVVGHAVRPVTTGTPVSRAHVASTYCDAPARRTRIRSTL